MLQLKTQHLNRDYKHIYWFHDMMEKSPTTASHQKKNIIIFLNHGFCCWLDPENVGESETTYQKLNTWRKDKPVSDAPTTTILLFTTSFGSKLNFLLMRLRANGACEERRITCASYTANILDFQNLAVGNLAVKTQVIFCYQLFYSREKSSITAAFAMLCMKVVKLCTESPLNADCLKLNLSSHLVGVARATFVTTTTHKTLLLIN